MSKPEQLRTYKKQLLKERGPLTRSEKNARRKQRNKQDRADRRSAAEERILLWRSFSPIKQLRELDFRSGVGDGAQKQRAKIIEKMSEEDYLEYERLTFG